MKKFSFPLLKYSSSRVYFATLTLGNFFLQLRFEEPQRICCKIKKGNFRGILFYFGLSFEKFRKQKTRISLTLGENVMKKFGLLLFVLSLVFASSVYAAELSGNLTVDDAFNLYLSTDDFSEGISLLSRPDGMNDEWRTSESFSTTLAPGTYYLHLTGMDKRQVIAGFLGDFTLTGNLAFSNGLQSLFTNTTNWTVRDTDWSNTTFGTLTSIGQNSVAEPWLSANGGPISGINNNAEWIWTDNGNFNDSPRFFSTKITVTPEPFSAALFLIGGVALSTRKLFKKRS
jgi:hypothetical protein